MSPLAIVLAMVFAFGGWQAAATGSVAGVRVAAVSAPGDGAAPTDSGVLVSVTQTNASGRCLKSCGRQCRGRNRTPELRFSTAWRFLILRRLDRIRGLIGNNSLATSTHSAGNPYQNRTTRLFRPEVLVFRTCGFGVVTGVDVPVPARTTLERLSGPNLAVSPFTTEAYPEDSFVPSPSRSPSGCLHSAARFARVQQSQTRIRFHSIPRPFEFDSRQDQICSIPD